MTDTKAPEMIEVESETGHANTYCSEDRKTWLTSSEALPDYFSAEYIRVDLHIALVAAAYEARDRIEHADAQAVIKRVKREARNEALRELREKWIVRDLTETDFTED